MISFSEMLKFSTKKNSKKKILKWKIENLFLKKVEYSILFNMSKGT